VAPHVHLRSAADSSASDTHRTIPRTITPHIRCGTSRSSPLCRRLLCLRHSQAGNHCATESPSHLDDDDDDNNNNNNNNFSAPCRHPATLSASRLSVSATHCHLQSLEVAIVWHIPILISHRRLYCELSARHGRTYHVHPSGTHRLSGRKAPSPFHSDGHISGPLLSPHTP
jgi:hypothetical protein